MLTREHVERAWIESRYQLALDAGFEPEPLAYAAEFREWMKSVLAEERERITDQRDALYAVLWDLDQRGLLPPCNDMTDGNGACTVCTAMESAANDGAHARIAREDA